MTLPFLRETCLLTRGHIAITPSYFPPAVPTRRPVLRLLHLRTLLVSLPVTLSDPPVRLYVPPETLSDPAVAPVALCAKVAPLLTVIAPDTVSVELPPRL